MGEKTQNQANKTILAGVTKDQAEVPLSSAPIDNKRPIIITVICIVGLMGSLGILLSIILPSHREQLTHQYGQSYIPALIILSTIVIPSFVGLWKMKKWGLYLYIVGQIAAGLYGLFTISNLLIHEILPLIIIIICSLNFKKMH